MDRLTFDGNFCDIAQCKETFGGKHCPDGYCSQRRVWERLKEYEDTGMEPEEIMEAENRRHDCKVECLLKHYNDLLEVIKELGPIDHLRELVQAEQEGRLMVLPCKVGDTVWFNTYAKNATVCLGVRPHRVCRFDISAVVPGEYIHTDLPLYEFGKSVFLTRKEAEAALGAQKGGEGNG